MDALEDDMIVNLFLNRSEDAIQQSELKYKASLFALAANILRDTSSAEECVNDTFLEAWNSIPPHEPRSYLFAYLARITRHISLDRCRERGRLKRSAILVELSEELEQCVPSADDTESRIEAAEFGRMISAFLRRLPDEQRNVFLRRYWYLDSIGDISESFALSESKVKSILYRARNKLKEQLKREGYVL